MSISKISYVDPASPDAASTPALASSPQNSQQNSISFQHSASLAQFWPNSRTPEVELGPTFKNSTLSRRVSLSGLNRPQTLFRFGFGLFGAKVKIVEMRDATERRGSGITFRSLL